MKSFQQVQKESSLAIMYMIQPLFHFSLLFLGYFPFILFLFIFAFLYCLRIEIEIDLLGQTDREGVEKDLVHGSLYRFNWRSK
jgi:hypothetical protein